MCWRLTRPQPMQYLRKPLLGSHRPREAARRRRRAKSKAKIAPNRRLIQMSDAGPKTLDVYVKGGSATGAILVASIWPSLQPPFDQRPRNA